MPQAPPRRRWFRFSLRTLLVVIFALSMASAAWQYLVQAVGFDGALLGTLLLILFGGTFAILGWIAIRPLPMKPGSLRDEQPERTDRYAAQAGPLTWRRIGKGGCLLLAVSLAMAAYEFREMEAGRDTPLAFWIIGGLIVGLGQLLLAIAILGWLVTWVVAAYRARRRNRIPSDPPTHS